MNLRMGAFSSGIKRSADIPDMRALLLLLYLSFAFFPLAVYADITNARVTPASLSAGKEGSVTVTLTSGVDVEQGGSVMVEFPTGFQISSGTSVAVVTAASTTTLSVASTSTTQISVQIGTAKISTGETFTFSMSDVTNPAEKTTAEFIISTYDSTTTLLETNTAVPSITIASTVLSNAAVAPDSLNAGVAGTATVSFTSAVRLAVGSLIKVTFPSDFAVKSTTLSSATHIDSNSAVTTSGSVVTVTIAGSAVTAASNVSFKLDGVKNPGAKTTGTFAVATTDGASNVFQKASNIGSVLISSTVLVGVRVNADIAVAGAESSYTVVFTTNVDVPTGGYIDFEVPGDVVFAGSLMLVDSVLSIVWGGEIYGHVARFKTTRTYASGLHSVQVQLLLNPGSSTTGLFILSTTDSNAFILESASAAGVDIVPGFITDAVLSPQLAHPGIASRVDISFSASAGLADDSNLIIRLPPGDYGSAVPVLSVAVVAPASSTAIATWDNTISSIQIFITSARIPPGAAVKLQVTALIMPPSIRAISTAATIESWDSQGLKLDEKSTLTLSAVTAVDNLPCTWATETPNPGITSNALITFKTNGMIPIGGKIVLKIPASDFYADSTGNTPAVVFISSAVVATAMWDGSTHALELIISGASIPALAVGVQVKILKLDTPVSVRSASRSPATLTTFDPLGIRIDGPSTLSMDAITAGFLLGSRLWTAVNAVAGVTSNQLIDFFITGRVDPGGKFEFTLPDSQWKMTASGIATFKAPKLGDVGSVVWDLPTRTMTVTLTGATSIPSYTTVQMLIQSVTNPPKEVGINNAYLTTRAADDSIIDGPDTISVMTISRGALTGKKTWTSVSTTSAAMRSDQLLSFSLRGALPSGSIILLTLPPSGWRMVNPTSVSVSFALPATGVTVQSADWSSTTCELRIVTAGDMTEGTPVQLLVNDMINPYTSSPAGSCSVTTMLPDAGVVAESNSIAVNAITSDPLPTPGSLVSDVSTPGVLSSQTLSFITGGRLEAGATFCLEIVDEWTLMASTVATLTLTSSGQSSPLQKVLDAKTNTLCMTTSVAISQETDVAIVLTDILSPESVRPQRVAKLLIQSHLGGLVNTGSVHINAIDKGVLSGLLRWQTLNVSPGPVAGLKTSAYLSFSTTGQVPTGGAVLVELPFEWVMASTCIATFVLPSVRGSVSCSQNNIRIEVLDPLEQATDVNIQFMGVYNPSFVIPEGVATCRTIAPDGGEIDETTEIVTGAIVAAVTGISNSGDHLVAVVGVTKKFTFEGSALAQSDVVKFVDGTTTSDANCGESTAGQSDVGGIGVKYLSESLDVSIKFTQSSPDQNPFAFCYKFGDNAFKLYTMLRITVKEIKSLSSIVGGSDVAVANYVKTWAFSGDGIVAGDQIRWIELDVAQNAAFVSSPPDCLDTSVLAKLSSPVSGALTAPEDDYTRVVQADSTASFAFSGESSGKTFCLCYKFGNEPFMVYPLITVQVNQLHSIEAVSTGSERVAVVEAPKSFRFSGDGVALNDRLYFVELGSVSTCEESDSDPTLQLLHMINAQDQRVLFIDSNLATTVNFDAGGAGMVVVPCYQFKMEPYQLYPALRVTVKMVKRYTGTLGSPQLAVADVPEPLTFLGHGLTSGDQVRWILHGQEDCESGLASLTDPNTLQTVDTITLDQNSAAVFNFLAVQSDFNPVLCYKFGEEKFKLYSDISIAIATIRGKTPLTGAKDIAVAGSMKNFTLVGANVAKGDRVGWTTALNSPKPCSSLSLLIRNPLNTDDDYLSYVTNANTFGVSLSDLSSGKRVYLCYGFGREPLKVFPGLYLDVKSITNMRALVASPSVTVAGALKTFLFDGDGVATGDFAKFVTSTSDCVDPGITLMNIMKEYDDFDEMAMYLYEISDTTTTGGFQVQDDKKSAGLGRVLCYRFGVEPFVYYEQFHIDVKTLWGLYQTSKATGRKDNVAIVNEPKRMTIDGVGVSVKDALKFVNASGTSDCVDLPAKGQLVPNLQVNSDLTVSLAFDYGSRGGTWALCYKFDDEPYRLYSSVVVTVKEITALLDSTFPEIAGLGGVATIGHKKQWKPEGSGVQKGDNVKIVPQSVTTSAECGKADANLATGTSMMTVGGTLLFSGTLTAFPASTNDVYHVCYQFQDEPFTYLRSFTLTAYALTGLEPNVVLVSASTTAQLRGFRLSDTDEIGWTTSTTNCSSMLGRTAVSGSKANVRFPDSHSQLFLCYSFNRQPFDLFKMLTLAVVKAEIWTPQTVSIIADQATKVDVSGTFGITQGTDEIAWVPSDAVDCSTLATYTQIMQTSVTSSSKSQSFVPHAGTAVFKAKYVAPGSGSGVSATDSFSTWKLCYRFGTTPDFLMFGDVLCTVSNIVQALLVDLQSTSSGAVMKFQFEGVGMQDFDSAKWIDATAAVSDADCNVLPPIGGSKTTDVINARATFAFIEESSSMALCYKFLGHAFKLYANLPIRDSTKASASAGQSASDALTRFDEEAAAAASDQFTANRDVASVSLTIDKDISEIPAGSNAEAAFKASFINTLATSLGIDASRIQITGLAAGSVIVSFELLPSESAADPIVSEVIRDLHAQLMDTRSALLSSNTVVVKNPTTALSITLSALPAPATTSVGIQALGYQENGLFSFVRGVYSVTEKSTTLVIPVIRLQGTASVMAVPVKVQSSGTTAVFGVDYEFSDATTFDETLKVIHLRFDIGESLQLIEVVLFDNAVKGPHFKILSLTILDLQTLGAALGTTKQTVVRIYDYEDGVVLAKASFADQQDVQGWQIVGNGASPLRVDGNGAFAVDDVFGEAEYNEKCDLAAPTGVCTYACELGGGLTPIGLDATYNVLDLDGDDFTASANSVRAFPSTDFTISLWVKTIQRDPSVCLYSYAGTSAAAPAVPLALCNPSNLQLYVNADSDVNGLVTFVNVSDNAWHFIAVTWQSEDGRARLYDNGMLVFDGGPYRQGTTIDSNGFFVVGSLVLSSAAQAPCRLNTDVVEPDVSCDVVPDTGFKGQIQHVHIWSRVLARSELLGELAWPLRVVSNGLVLGWNFDSSFLLQQGQIVKDLSMQGQELKNRGVLHCTNRLQVAANSSVRGCIIRGQIPRLDAAFPCGPVFTNIWHFSAPVAFTSNLKNAYGGRLQFRLLAPSFNGSPRPRRGQISIFSSGQVAQISIALGSFDLPVASRWTYYSVVLREDFGWIREPTGDSLTADEFNAVLAGATVLWIRGDIWGYDATGSGQEVVYLNEVALYAR
ncbi:hypothetical protein P3T76_010073 [Phytophthora citrophthora]|uniref:Pentraxin (PTX) domain-containing protein n=1 Tax=Phytophthora citrophthora TaxID=4793 RepID=A0AAD9LH98_9STRA|nr:hypothetical protein P3T76_010073 [Phytophthora citrophthora]